MLWPEKGSKTLYFAEDCPEEGLRGEHIVVRKAISFAEYQELETAPIKGVGVDSTGENEARLSLGRTTIQRLALWIVECSWPGLDGKPFGRKGRRERERWFGDMDPFAATQVDLLLQPHVNEALAKLLPPEEEGDEDGSASNANPPANPPAGPWLAQIPLGAPTTAAPGSGGQGLA